MAVTINLNLPDEVTVGTTDVVSGTDGTLLRNEGGKVGDTDYTVPKTDGTAGQVLQTNGAGTATWQTVGGGLTIGTTAITSGTVGRILFEGSGNVVQQDSTLFWDNTNKRLGIGATPAASTRLDVRAQGALSTDIALRVRNSADTANIIDARGNGLVNLCSGASGSEVVCLGEYGYSSGYRTYFNGIQFKYGGGGYGTRFEMANGFLRTNDASSLLLGTQTSLGSGTGQLIVGNATAPTGSITDSFQLYSADIVAGNAAPHFRTENGAIIKLYQETTGVAAATLVSGGGTALTDTDTFDGYTLKQIVKALRNNGLLA
jgi:hypothetical protein